MHDLITKYFTKEITLSEKKELFEELQKNPDLRKEFEDLQNVYGLTAFTFRQDDLAAGRKKLFGFKKIHSSVAYEPKRRNHYLSVFGYAAAIMIAVVSTLFVQGYYYDKTKVYVPAQTYEEFHTPVGQRALITLSDGTKVWLNSQSTLRYPNYFSETHRSVQLSGEAYFEVAHRENYPFIVRTNKANVEVMGTKFNVFSYNNSRVFTTSLLEGSVKVYKNGEASDAIVLKPHEKLDLVDNAFSKSDFDSEDFLMWKDGIYFFDDLPFNELVSKLELYYDMKIIQKNKSLNKYRFSGKFRQRDGVENVLRTLQKINNFSFVKAKDSDVITIY